jgi:hypothetical protein
LGQSLIFDNEYSNVHNSKDDFVIIKLKNNSDDEEQEAIQLITISKKTFQIRNVIRLTNFPNEFVTYVRNYNSRLFVHYSGKRLLIGTFQRLFVFKVNKNASVRLISDVKNDEFLCDELLFFDSQHKDEVVLAGKVQKRVGQKGGIKLIRYSLTKNEIVEKAMMLVDESIFFYFNSNYNYTTYSSDFIYSVNPCNNFIVRLNTSFRIIDSSDFIFSNPHKKDPSQFQSLETLYAGQIRLLDTVEKISQAMNRILHFSMSETLGIALVQESISDSITIVAYLITENRKVKRLEIDPSILRVMRQSKFILDNGKLYCFTSFGNINYLNNTLNETELYQKLLREKPMLGMYVFSIVL